MKIRLMIVDDHAVVRMGLRMLLEGESDFEIVGVDVDLREPAFDDYLVRLSSQWRWSSTNIDKLVLKASGPVMVGEVLLRRGD